jgi:hypothetical protein
MTLPGRTFTPTPIIPPSAIPHNNPERIKPMGTAEYFES